MFPTLFNLVEYFQSVMSGMGALSLLTVDHVDTEWQLSVMERVLFTPSDELDKNIQRTSLRLLFSH
jgi:hypothetical protein